MNQKTGKAETLLLYLRYNLRPPISNPNWANSTSFRPSSHLNIKPSSQNDSARPNHNLTSSATSYNHCTRSGYLLNSLYNTQVLPFCIIRTRAFCRTPGVQHSTDRAGSTMRYNRRSSLTCNIGLGPEKLAGIVEEISRDADDMESKLVKLNFMISPTTVIEVLCVLNDRGLSAGRFFYWVLKYRPGFKPNSEIFNLIVNNHGRLEDYISMRNVLNELSHEGHCVTEKAFTFLRGSGIHSLIKLLCAMNCFELALLVMGETVRKTSYYNLLIAAKCKDGNFREVMNSFDEMRRHGCDPTTKSYNYLLGSLFKRDRVIEACELLQLMEDSGFVPDLVTYEVVAFHACKANRLDYAVEILNMMLSEGLKPRRTTHAAFIKGFFWSGRVENAYKYVIEMGVKDKCSNNCNYSLLVDLLRVSGRVVEAGRILHEMMVKGLKPNFPVYVKVLKELHKIGRGDLASELKSMFLKFDSVIDAG